LRAAIFYGKKDIRVENTNDPIPADNEAIIRVMAAGICGSDLHYYAEGRSGVFQPVKPFVLGHEFLAPLSISRVKLSGKVTTSLLSLQSHASGALTVGAVGITCARRFDLLERQLRYLTLMADLQSIVGFLSRQFMEYLMDWPSERLHWQSRYQ
jgi:hypothetical protein